jgi:hypothetical protein
LYLNNGNGSIQFGSGSTSYTLLPLNTPISGDINLIGNISASGDVRIGGNIYLGDSLANDSINVNSPFSGSIIPSGSNTFDLGTSTNVYRNVYANRVSASFFTGSLSGSVNGIDVTNFSTSVDSRLDSLEIKTGSYATTGSNNFIGNQNITGSFIVSGSNIELTRDWPEVGSQSHFLRLSPFTSSTNRYYEGLGIGIEHWNDGTGTYEHSLLIHSFDNDANPNYGAELNVGPYRTHMRVYPSGSNGELANVSVQELSNGKSQALVYGDYVQIGAFNGEDILIGNTGSLITITGSNMLFDTPLTSSHPIVATLFSGSISGIGNVTQFSSSISDRFTTIATVTGSFDNRLDLLEISSGALNLFTSSLNDAIQLTGSTVSFLGNIVVYGTQSVINSINLEVADNIIYLNATSSTTNVDLGIVGNYNDGTYAHTGIYRDSSDGVWRVFKGYTPEPSGNIDLSDPSYRYADFYANEISASSYVGIGNITAYSTSVDSRLDSLETTNTTGNVRLDNLELFSSSILSQNVTLSSYTASIDNKINEIHTFTSSTNTRLGKLEESSASLNLFTASVYDTNTFTSSANSRLSLLETSTGSLNSFTQSVNDRFTTLQTYTSSINSDLTSIHQTTSSLNITTASLNTWTGSIFTTYSTSVDIRLDELEYTTSINFGAGAQLSFTQLNNFTASILAYTQSANTKLNNLESTTASLNTSVSNLNTFTASVSTASLVTSISNLNTFSASALTRLTEIESYTGSLKSAISLNGSNVTILGDLNVQGTTTVIETTTLQVEDNIVELNYGGTSTNAGIITRDVTGASTTSGSLLWDGTSDIWIAGKLGSEAKILTDGMGVISGSGQLTNYETTGRGIVSGSSQIVPLLPSGVVSGSSQVLDGSGVWSGSVQLPAGVISGSSQVTLSSTTGGSTTSDVQFGSLGIGTAASGVSGEIRATGDIVAFYSSDERLKENIQPIQNALSKVESISGNTYDWKEGFETIHSHTGHDLGVIAQEVQSVLPEVVTERETGYLAVDYVKLVPVLIEAIKELSAKVKELENK